MNLNEIFNTCATDKGTTQGAKHNYAPIYEPLLQHLREQPITMLEIGIDFGNSINAWELYFPNATIHAADISPKPAPFSPRIHYHVLNQSMYLENHNVGASIGPMDLIIDDGGHCMDHQQISFGTLFPYLKPKGIYIIEDTHTSNMTCSHIYGQLLKPKGPDDSTINVFRDFQRTGSFRSPYFTDEINMQITSMIDTVTIWGDGNVPVEPDSNEHHMILRNGVITITRK